LRALHPGPQTLREVGSQIFGGLFVVSKENTYETVRKLNPVGP
jgi:hypothetical protein